MIIEREDGTFEGVPAGCIVRRTTVRESMYGSYHGGDPREFMPDVECNTPEEIAAHKAACESWDRGEHVEAEHGRCDIRTNMICCSYGAFGLGVYTIEMDALEVVDASGNVVQVCR